MLLARTVFLRFLSAKFPLFIKQIRKARRIFDKGWEQMGCVNQMDETGLDHLDLRQ